MVRGSRGVFDSILCEEMFTIVRCTATPSDTTQQFSIKVLSLSILHKSTLSSTTTGSN